MQIDLRTYIAEKAGTWSDNPDAFTANKLVLSNEGDGVALVGPLRIRVTLQGENITFRYGGQALTREVTAAQRIILGGTSHTNIVYSYLLDIPPLQVWSYLVSGAEIVGKLGTNRGFNLLVEPGGSPLCEDDYPGQTCPKDCGCGGKNCGCDCNRSGGDDLPCDYAVSNIPNLGRFFPAACEPCPSDACISVPQVPGPQGLLVRPANGGCERPRYFNGMFVTREDMEAEQRFLRLKFKLHNRASGDGVVWGLCVSRDGNDIVVYPGYAVDCCGNDLTITSPYRVEIPSLVRDPAAAKTLAKPGAHSMHLLLEYTECPEDPRPVHGDPCSPQVTSCEMSRIRETARLRLVPPECRQGAVFDCDTPGPIQRFFDDLQKIHPISEIPPAPGSPPDPTLPRPIVPFDLRFRSGSYDKTLSPNTDVSIEDSTGSYNGQAPIATTMVVKGSWTLSGTVNERVGAGPPNQVGTLGASSAGWNATMPATSPVGHEIRWRAEGSDGVIMEGVTTVNFFLSGAEISSLFISIPKTPVEVSKKQVPFPCLSEACSSAAGENTPLFPVFPPFLHADPYKPSQPGDPKVIALAALYAWLAGEIERGDKKAILLAAQVYVAAAKLLFAVEGPAELVAMAERLKQLLAEWCKASLYPGPRCQGDPHGVVIGCAVVAGGEIQSVDPWGGRRYVVHYPLLEYWGAMFGLAPLDLTAQRLFSLICCLAGLPGLGALTRGRGVASVTEAFANLVAAPSARPAPASAMPIGPAMLFLHPEAAANADAALGVSRIVSVGPVEMVSYLVSALRQPPDDAAGPRVRLEGLGLNLVIPASAMQAPTASGAAPSYPDRK